MGKKFNELAELRDRSRQLMDENRRLRLALKVSEGRAQQLAWKNEELRNQVEKRKAHEGAALGYREVRYGGYRSDNDVSAGDHRDLGTEEVGCFASVRRKGGGEMSGAA